MHDFLPLLGDYAGNNIKWDSMKLEADMYLRTGNYALLRDVRMRQALFTESEGELRIALSYYCMVFYTDLNGFSNMDHLKEARLFNFRDWNCTAKVDVGIVNKIFFLCSQLSIADDELLSVFCYKAFKPKSYLYHIFTVKECTDILLLSKQGNIGRINLMIQFAESRLRSENCLCDENIVL